MKKFTHILAMLLALAMIFSLAACGSATEEKAANDGAAEEVTGAAETAEEDASETAGEDGYDVINIGAYTSYFVSGLEVTGAQQIVSTQAYGIAGLVYDRMFYPNSEGKMVSDIIESYEYSDDSLSLTLQLKEGVTFASGDPMTGEDILFSLALMQTSAKPAYYMCINVENSSVSEDGLTVTFAYDYPYGPGVNYLDFYVVNKSHYEALAPDGDYSKVNWYQPEVIDGSGAYEIVEYSQDVSAKLVKRDDYWGDADRFDFEEYNLFCYTDQTTMYIDYENGVIDVALGLLSNDLARVQDGEVENGGYGIIDSNSVVMLCLNENNEFLADPAVREAICYAIDIDVVTETAAGTLGVAAKSSLAEKMSAFSDGHAYPYDPEHSRQVLADAGYADGDITLHYITSADSDQAAIAELVLSFLSDIGITVEIETLDMATMMPALMQGQSDFQRQTASDGTPQCEPYEVYSAFASDSVFPAVAISDSAINEALQAGYQTVDVAARDEAYKTVQELLYEGYWVVPLYEWKAAYAYNAELIADDIFIPSLKKADLRWIGLAE